MYLRIVQLIPIGILLYLWHLIHNIRIEYANRGVF